MKKLYALAFLVSLVLSLKGQGIRDTSLLIPMFSAAYTAQLPGGDLADRYGFSNSIGGTFGTKLESNWIFSLEYNYMFGKNLKETGIFDSIDDSNGELITIYGDYAKMNVSERGFHASIKAGKIIPILSPNPNSGITLMLGGGMLQHKMWIEVDGNNAPQIGGEYRKGYDRLTSGFALSQFVGYTYFSPSKYVNFYAGFEFVQAMTMSRRSYNFDTMEFDNKQRLDMIYSFRFGWLVPLNKRMPDKYYTY